MGFPGGPQHRGTESGHRAGSRKAPRSETTHDSSRCRSTHCAGFCADHRASPALSVWEADCQLPGTGAAGRVERKSETAGAYHEARKLDSALFAGGGGAGHSAQCSRVAQQVCPPHDAARRLAVALYWMWRKGWNYEQCKSSVRTRARSEQAMVCSSTPSN
jgi:hypothetical protein